MKDSIRGYIKPVLIVCTALAIVLVAADHFLEIKTITQTREISRAAAENPYLAFERWMRQEKIALRIVHEADITRIRRAEKATVLLHTKAVSWGSRQYSELFDMVQNGSRLVLIVDRISNVLEQSLDSMAGIRIQRGPDCLEDAGQNGPLNTPDFDTSYCFAVGRTFGAANVTTDEQNMVRLVHVDSGNGELYVSGAALFLESGNIADPANAALAWELGAGRREIYWVRPGPDDSSLLPGLFLRRSSLALLITIILLIVMCFWISLSVFGKPLADIEPRGRSIRDRFLAEADFLGRHKALNGYIGEYQLLVRKRLRQRDGNDYDAGRLQKRIAQLTGIPEKELGLALERPGSLSTEEFIKRAETLEQILEKL